MRLSGKNNKATNNEDGKIYNEMYMGVMTEIELDERNTLNTTSFNPISAVMDFIHRLCVLRMSPKCHGGQSKLCRESLHFDCSCQRDHSVPP